MKALKQYCSNVHTAKQYYKLFEFLNDTLVHMQPEV